MTNEEAIELIKIAQAEVEWSCPMDYAAAFDLAIKALEQEPCEDCISRQEVLNDIQSNWDWETVDGITATTVLKQVMTDITNAPSVTPTSPKSEWIPVSEELPENGSLVLTTIQVPGREPHVRSGMYFNGLFSNNNGDVWKATDEEVKAWMPLSEPYKAERSSEDADSD